MTAVLALAGAATLGIGVATFGIGFAYGAGLWGAIGIGATTFGIVNGMGSRWASGQSLGQSVGGGLADGTGVGDAYGFFAGADIATGQALTPGQQALAGVSTGLNVLSLGLAGRGLGRIAFARYTGSVRSVNPTIAAGVRGNPRAIVRGVGELSSSQRAILSQLDSPGAQVLLRKSSVTQTDLAALTAETGDEFAMFTTGGRRLVVRGRPEGYHGIIDGDWAASMRAQGWRWSAHSHPIYEGVPTRNFLRSSAEDQALIGIFGQNQSAIMNSVGERRLFGPSGDLLYPGWLP